MRRTNYHQIIGVEQQASPAEIYQVYGHWRSYVKPLLEEDADRAPGKERWSRKLALHQMEEAFDVLMKSRNPARVH